jgi:Cys-rich repeat protein
MRVLGLLVGALALVGCNKAIEEGNDPNNKRWITAAKCKTDKDCAEGFVCEAEGDGKVCKKGERTAAEKAAAKKAEQEAHKAAQAAKKAVKPGEGRLHVRVCPFFKNTPESIGTITAIHQETKQKHVIHMALETPDLGFQDQFTFWSVPLGKYDVQATYGIQKGGKPNVSTLKCDEKSKLECVEETTRVIEVVPPDQEPKPELNEKGKPKPRPCDFIAE